MCRYLNETSLHYLLQFRFSLHFINSNLATTVISLKYPFPSPLSRIPLSIHTCCPLLSLVEYLPSFIAVPGETYSRLWHFILSVAAVNNLIQLYVLAKSRRSKGTWNIRMTCTCIFTVVCAFRSFLPRWGAKRRPENAIASDNNRTPSIVTNNLRVCSSLRSSQGGCGTPLFLGLGCYPDSVRW